jgi:hypothetical protein
VLNHRSILPQPEFLFFGEDQSVEKQNHTDADGRIGHVESGPMVTAVIDVNEINNLSQPNPIDNVP